MDGQNFSTQRRHDLDWLRFLAILILLFFHTGMLFNPWEWHIKNPETDGSFRYWMVWLHQWRMPLLLFISGAGTYMALGKRSPGQYAAERARRLIIPLIFGMFVIVPPQIYYERIGSYAGYGEFYRTVFSFVPYPAGSFSWHHLWFIAYLFCFSLIALPFLIYIRGGQSTGFQRVAFNMLSKPSGILLVPAVILVTTQAFLRPYFPDETHALFNDWAYFVFYFLFFVFGMLCYANPKLWESIGDNRHKLLIGSGAALLPFYLLYFHFRGIVQFPFPEDTVDILFSIAAIFVSWFTVITVIGFGQHYLNRPHPLLKHFNEGLYPFYILHQTVIIAIGFYVCQTGWSIGIKFWTVGLLTLAVCVAIYFVAIRPFNAIRILFGMKWIRSGKKGSKAVQVSSPSESSSRR